MMRGENCMEASVSVISNIAKAIEPTVMIEAATEAGEAVDVVVTQNELQARTLWQLREAIPLAQGVVGYAEDANKALLFAAPNATENPLGNSTNSMFDLVHIDRLTGRAEQLQQKVQ